MGVIDSIGIQSYCYRGFKKNEEVIEKLKASGASAIELCGVHADFSTPAAFEKVAALYKEAGIDIVSIGVQGMADDEATERKYFECARIAGARHMSVDFRLPAVPGAYRTAEKLADEFDMQLGIHNHGGRHWLGSAQMLEAVFAQTSERIGLCLDTAWALDAHEDPVAMAEKFGKRLTGLHLKDFVFDRAGKPEDVVVGTGNLDLPALHKALRAAGFSGMAVIEYEGDVDNPVPALAECVKAVKAEFGA